MPVSLTAARGPGTVCTDAQPEPAQVEQLGAQPSQEGTQPHSPSQTHIYSICPLFPRDNTYQGLATSVAANQREVYPGEGNSLLKTSGDRYKRQAARIDMVSATSALTSTQTSAGTRVGAMKHPQRQYPRILMDRVVSLQRETQSRPQPLQRKVTIKVSRLHRADFCCGE